MKILLIDFRFNLAGDGAKRRERKCLTNRIFRLS